MKIKTNRECEICMCTAEEEKKEHNRNVILNISYLHNRSVCAQRGVNLILNCCVVFNIQQ